MTGLYINGVSQEVSISTTRLRVLKVGYAALAERQLQQFQLVRPD